MQKNDHHISSQIITKAVLISLSLFLIACGENSPSTGGNPGTTDDGNAARIYKPLPLNDTGVTFFIDNEITGIVIDGKDNLQARALEYSAEPVNFPAQDAKFGRDISNPTAVGGTAGFNFLKMDKDTGAELAENSIDFGCVQDLTTGLFWENKTDTKKSTLSDYYKLHNSAAKHSWYDPNKSTNGGNEGQKAVESSCPSDVIATDTFNFVQAVNEEKLCGFNDWRIPTVEELRSLVNFSVADGTFVKPMVDSNFFPYIATTLHRWTSQTQAFTPDRAFGYHFHDGLVQSHNKFCKKENSTNYGNGAIVVRGVF